MAFKQVLYPSSHGFISTINGRCTRFPKTLKKKNPVYARRNGNINDWKVGIVHRMEGRKAKELSFIKGEIVNREQEFIKLEGRKIYRGESQKPRVRTNLIARIFADLGCRIWFVEKNGFSSRLRKGVVRATLPQNIKDVYIGKWYGLWNSQMEEKPWKPLHIVCTYTLFFPRRNRSWSQMWLNISAWHSIMALMKSWWKDGKIA